MRETNKETSLSDVQTIRNLSNPSIEGAETLYSLSDAMQTTVSQEITANGLLPQRASDRDSLIAHTGAHAYLLTRYGITPEDATNMALAYACCPKRRTRSRGTRPRTPIDKMLNCGITQDEINACIAKPTSPKLVREVC